MRQLLPLLPRPSRHVGIEEGACRKSPESVSLRVALAFPDTYDVGMSYLGQKILYGIVNARENWWAERVMAPDRESGEILRRHAAPLCTLESGLPIGRADCVSFSITNELCYTNVLYMLDLGGIPLHHADRPDDLSACPLIFAGGGALLSAEPLVPFLDFCVLGDGEETLVDVLDLLEKAKAAGWGRARYLEEARHIPGVYVPSFFTPRADGSLHPRFADHARPARRIVADLDSAPYPVEQVVPVGAVHNRLSLEIARGCTRGCRFCHAGMVYRPVRERSLDNIARLLEDCLNKTGYDEISFLSLSTGDFSALKTLSNRVLDRCVHEQVSLSLPSLRVGSIDDDIMRRMADIRRTGCTLAPEAGSQRLRDVINKGVSEEQLLLHVQKLLEYGWRQVKLYFMIGLPTETDDDLLAIADLCRKVRDAAGRGNPRLQVTAALSPFVPKPFTPFQWVEQIGMEEMERRVRLVREAFKGQKFLKLRWHEPSMSHLEGILSRAGRELAPVVEAAYRKGAIFTSWVEEFSLAPWYEALAENGLDPAAYIAARPQDATLPWDHLEAGISPDFLRREWERAQAAKVTDDCRYGACRACGACDTPARPSRLPHAGIPTDGGPLHRNRLIFSQRDQSAHQPHRDAEGRIICREREKKPPRIAPELTVKAAQFRVWHSKTDGCAYLSQLELQSLLERALRRARLPMSFSQGFHPLPLMSFGRALPVGVESRAEWFAITLREPLAAAEVARRLRDVLPPGMDILHVESVDGSRRTEQSVRETFRLSVDGVDGATLAEVFARFAGEPEHPLTRETRKGPRTADIRPLLGPWAQDGDAVTFTLDWTTLYLSPAVFCLEVLAPLGEAGSLRPVMHLCKTEQHFAADPRRGKSAGNL
ncbi:TIGR03960 family B12-binding radical SAM protein [uncultured Desulfovibrio sp.]|uniref:TIGR03960 family B12-binding radical SAM protein n=1 Tax=uncultured Desulfovibrio sp. TaxID=167968 RepID=UPI003208C51E